MPPNAALRRLAEFLEEAGSGLSPTQVAAAAIADWIAAERAQVRPLAATPTRGYQWKALFLPDGSELRMYFAGKFAYARVEGDRILYDGRPVSPRQLTIAIAGSGRNAWRDLWIRLPLDPTWRLAAVLRREREQQGAPPQVSPQEAMASAAACMSQALKTALALVEQSNARALPNFERRVERHRRAQDVLDDTCQFD